jgi:hypothetical protein
MQRHWTTIPERLSQFSVFISIFSPKQMLKLGLSYLFAWVSRNKENHTFCPKQQISTSKLFQFRIPKGETRRFLFRTPCPKLHLRAHLYLMWI